MTETRQARVWHLDRNGTFAIQPKACASFSSNSPNSRFELQTPENHLALKDPQYYMRIKYLAAFLIPAISLCGCGGGGLLNPFTGTFNGTWTQSSPSDTGTIAFVVLPSGSLSGTLHDNGAAADYTVSGSINDNGGFSATLTPTVGSASTLSGTLGFDVQNHLTGNLGNVPTGAISTISVNMTGG